MVTPANRIEITLSDERLAALDEARGHEPRASFIKRWTERGIAAVGNVERPPAEITDETHVHGRQQLADLAARFGPKSPAARKPRPKGGK